MRYCSSDLDRLYLSVFFRKVYHLHADTLAVFNLSPHNGRDFADNQHLVAVHKQIRFNVENIILRKIAVVEMLKSNSGRDETMRWIFHLQLQHDFL